MIQLPLTMNPKEQKKLLAHQYHYVDHKLDAAILYLPAWIVNLFLEPINQQ